jgi:hypothetical protein
MEEFQNHMHSTDHKERVELEEKACFCRLCRKQFTSPLQLSEHLKGKAHKELLQRRMKSSRKLQPSSGSRNCNYDDSR